MSVKSLFDLTGKTALVTGGSRGLGLQIAEALGEMGARLVLSARKADELEAACTHLKSHGITVSALAPGFFPSKMTSGVIAQLGADVLANLAPLQRIGGEGDLKGAALLFASDAGRHITGQVLAVDGGMTAV